MARRNAHLKQDDDPLVFDCPQVAPPLRSQRAREVARWFSLQTPDSVPLGHCIDEDVLKRLIPAPGQIVLLTGPSGSGKSSLMSSILTGIDPARVVRPDTLTLPEQPIVDCFPRQPLESALQLLALVGLGEAWSCLRTPSELSDGQRWRLNLALAIAHPTRSARGEPSILIVDEFCALLDRITAVVIARSLRRVMRRDPSFGVILATSHDDLTTTLEPDIVVACDFEKASWKTSITRPSLAPGPDSIALQASLPKPSTAFRESPD